MPDAVIKPLEVFILDEDFKRLTGSIPYDSLIWHRRYYGVGEFQMQVRSSLYSTDWAYVYCEDRPETGIIQKVEYDDTTEGPRNGEDTIIVSGFFLEEVLNRLVFLVEESEQQEVVQIVPKPTRPGFQASKPQFKQDADGNYYAIWKNGTINNLMNGQAARVEDSQELIAGLVDADVQPGKGIYQKQFIQPDGTFYSPDIYSSSYNYVSADGKVTVIDKHDKVRSEYDVVGDPSSGLVLYRDTDGSVKWVNGAVESFGDASLETYRRRRQKWEQYPMDPDTGQRYYTEYKTVEGPWMLRTDLDDVTTPQDNVAWVVKIAQRTFQGNFTYDKPEFSGEVKTLTPSLSRIGDYFYKELQTVEASFRVIYDFVSDQMTFSVWRGIDRTQEGGGQTPVEPVALMAASAEPDVPIGYEKLEYIESSGTQYVDTGVKPTQGTRVVMDVQCLRNVGDNMWLYCGRDGTRVNAFGAFWVNDRAAFGGTYGDKQEYYVHRGEVTERLSIDHNMGVLEISGDSHDFGAATFSSSSDIALLARNTGGVVDAFAVARLYSCQVSSDSVMQRNLVPARRQQDSAVGLYDTVTGTFYGNSGTGEFVAGPVVSVADSLTYDSNGGEGSMDPTPGYVGDAVVVEANGFTRDGYDFRVWNTQADGAGTDYAPLSEYTLTAGADVLYAQWDEVPEPPQPVPEGAGAPWAVFSDTWGTLYNYAASHDVSNYRNLAYVLYEYDEPVWDESGNVEVFKQAEYAPDENGDAELQGYHFETRAESRRGYLTVRIKDERPDAEIWVDRRGDAPGFMSDFSAGECEENATFPFTKADFDAWVEALKTDAESTLRSDYGDVDNLHTGTISTMRYLYDFDLGDKVDMAVEAVGMEKTARISEVEEVYESGSAEIRLTMGEELLTTNKKSMLV